MKKISHAKIYEVNTDCLETNGASKLGSDLSDRSIYVRLSLIAFLQSVYLDLI